MYAIYHCTGKGYAGTLCIMDIQKLKTMLNKTSVPYPIFQVHIQDIRDLTKYFMFK